jgi:hypothetical protein
MRIIIYIIAIFTIACSNNSSVEHEELPSKTLSKPHIYVAQTLNDYFNFISKLDTNEVNSIGEALRKFKYLFANENTTNCDSAYFIFHALYAQIDTKLNEKLMQDTLDYYALFEISTDTTNPIIIQKEVSAYALQLKKNAFELTPDGEGGILIEQNRDTVNAFFYDKVSNNLKKFLAQVNKEINEGLGADGGLFIDPDVFAERILFWENFLIKYPNFYYSKEIESQQRTYLHILINGADNTPLMDFDNEKKISSYFDIAYNYLFEKSPNGKISILVKPYYLALKNNDKKKAEELLNKFNKEKLIVEYY